VTEGVYILFHFNNILVTQRDVLYQDNELTLHSVRYYWYWYIC